MLNVGLEIGLLRVLMLNVGLEIRLLTSVFSRMSD